MKTSFDQPVRRRARRWAGIGVMVISIAVVAGACGSSDDSSDSSTSGNGSATIETFDVAKAEQCPDGKTSTTTSVHYEVSGAEKQQLLVDGAELPDIDESSGTVDVPVHCDDLPHTFVLIAYDADGGKTVKQKLLTTELAS